MRALLYQSLLIAGAIGVGLTAAAATIDAGHSAMTANALFDDSNDVVLLRAPVPSAEKPHGEVCLIRRDDALVMRTVLHSKLLKRAVARIAEKERQGWPESVAGHEESEAYVTALREARTQVALAHQSREDRSDRRQRLLIEFALVDDRAFILLAEPQLANEEGMIGVVSRRELAVLEPSISYVRENMRLIAVDALGMTPEEAAALIP